MTYDQWMNLSGCAGVVTYLSAYYCLVRGFMERTDTVNRIMRFSGLTMILIPLFVRWFLPQPLLLTVGVLMAFVSGLAMLRRTAR